MEEINKENMKLKEEVKTLGTKLKIKYHKFMIDVKEIKLGKKIKGGMFGDVYNGKWKGSGGGVKVIVQKIKIGKKRKMETVFEELDIATGLNHPLCVRYYGYAKYSENEVLVVMEKADMHSLRYTLMNSLNLYERFKILRNMTKAVHHLHSKGILHRNLKSIHFLMSSDGHTFKISEFASGRTGVDDYDTIEGEGIGTVNWLAPEIACANGVFSRKSDMYALGMCFYEIVYGEVPFHDFKGDENELIQEIRNGKSPNFDVKPIGMDIAVPNDVKELIQWLTKKDQRSRPLTPEVLKWFRKKTTQFRFEYGKKDKKE